MESATKRVEIVALGGCHILGHPISQDHSFPSLLAEMLGGEVVMRVGHLQFMRLPEHLAAVGALRPSHVVFQLGNYEFSASLRHSMDQFKRAFGAQPTQKESGDSSRSISSSFSAAGSAMAPGREAWPVHYYIRVAGLGLLTAALWLLTPRHRAAFRALNEFMRQHPETDFIFLSAFPCLDPAANALRRLGGRLLRGGLASLPNCHWLDTHRLLRPDPALFADLHHLNRRAHCALAHGLAALALSHGGYNPFPDLEVVQVNGCTSPVSV